MEITNTEKRILDLLPTTTKTLAGVLGCSESTVRTHCQNLKDKGFNTEVRDGVRYLVGEPSITNYTSPKASRAEITRRANDYLYERKSEAVENVAGLSPIQADGGLTYRPENFDVVLNLTDLHVGRKAHDEYGQVTFDINIIDYRVTAILTRTIEEINRLVALGYEVDTLHLLLGGDTVDGEVIYTHQPFEVEMTLDKQITTAEAILFTAIQRLSEAVPSVNVVCQPGNHGEIRLKGTSEQFNADGIVYAELQRYVHLAGFDNVSFRVNESTVYTNFPMRGGKWTGHLRHGQDVLSHVGTSSPQNTWKSHKLNHNFDLAFRGHYHELKVEPLHDAFVIMSPSISPGGDYEDSLGVAGGHLGGAFVLVGDDFAFRGITPIFFDNPSEERDAGAQLPEHELLNLQ
jgi:biotin operon repressor